MDDGKLLIVRGMLREATSFKDKAGIIEKEIGMETIYSLIAIGLPEDQISKNLGLNTQEFSYLLRQTADHRQKYIKTKAFMLSDDSAKTLEKFGDAVSLEPDVASALNHHGKNIDRALRMGDDTTEMSGVIINNILTVRGEGEVPRLPDELQGVIDVTPVN